MRIIYVRDFTEWRTQARQLLSQHIQPDAVQWLETHALQASLFHEEKIITDQRALINQAIFNIPRTIFRNG